MSDEVLAFPLSWPVIWPRTERRTRARFDTSFARARDGIRYEVQLLGGRDLIISTNVPLRRDGFPYANANNPEDPGVAVYFTRNGKQNCIPCDRWDRVADNMQAINKTIEALRGLDRWGAKDIVDAAFQGFAALPAATASQSWWSVLGVSAQASLDEIERAYRAKARESHPDAGGSPEAFHAISEAYRQGKAARP